MASIVQRLLGFDRLIGPHLVKLVYYVGLAAIAASAGLAFVTGLQAVLAGNLSQGLTHLIAAPAVGAAALIYWRFLCELFMLAFQAFDRLGEVRDLLRTAVGAPDPDHPEF